MSIPVLVWTAFGSPKVMRAETPAHYFQIISELKVATEGWGDEVAEELAKVEHKVGIATSHDAAQAIVKRFVRPHIGTHESFDAFDFTILKD